MVIFHSINSYYLFHSFLHHTVLHLLPTRTLHNSILLLRNPIIPPFVIVLINPVDLPVLVNLHNHADMTHEVLSTRLDGDLAIRADDVICALSVPDLLNHYTHRGGNDGLPS